MTERDRATDDSPDNAETGGPVTLHATTVALGGRGLLIRGASGTGKSGLALELMSRGADLVADDRTRLWREGPAVMAVAPDTIRGRIEARGLGILSAPATGPVPLALIVDLDREDTDRLPEWRDDTILGVTLPVAYRSGAPHFAAALAVYLRGGRLD